MADSEMLSAGEGEVRVEERERDTEGEVGWLVLDKEGVWLEPGVKEERLGSGEEADTAAEEEAPDEEVNCPGSGEEVEIAGEQWRGGVIRFSDLVGERLAPDEAMLLGRTTGKL